MRDYLDARHQFEGGLVASSANGRIETMPDDDVAVMKSSLRGGFDPLVLDCTALLVLNASARIRIDVAELLPGHRLPKMPSEAVRRDSTERPQQH